MPPDEGPGRRATRGSTAIPGAMATPCIRDASAYDTASLDRHLRRALVRSLARAPRHRRIRAYSRTTGTDRGRPVARGGPGWRGHRRRLHEATRESAALAFAVAVVAAGGSGSSASGRQDAQDRRSRSRCPAAAAADGRADAQRAPSWPIERGNAKGGVGGYTIQLIPARPCRQRQVRRAAGRQGHETLVNDRRSSASSGRSTRPSRRSRSRSATTAGLLQCSPANTNPSLTKPEFGAARLPPDQPRQINYIRVATTDDIQGPAVARSTPTTPRPQERLRSSTTPRPSARASPTRSRRSSEARRHRRRSRRRRPKNHRLHRHPHRRQGPQP